MRFRTFLSFAGLAMACLATANVNLYLRPVNPRYVVGDLVSVDLVAVTDSANELIGALQVIVKWDKNYLNPISSSDTRTKDARGAYSWLLSGFFDPTPLNTSLADGDAMWTAFAQFLNSYVASPGGTVLTTFKFKAKRFTKAGDATAITLIPAIGNDQTLIYGGNDGNTNLTGLLFGTTLKIGPSATPTP